jgi:hypothetical protein
MTTRTAKVKSTWSHRVSKVIARIFSIIKGIIKALWEVIEHCLETVTFFFGLLVRVVANPTTPCVVAILFFMFVSMIAAIQWFAIGVWIGKAFGLGGMIGGISSGSMGLLMGLGLNVYQLSSELWKLRRDVAKAYADMNVDPDFDASEPTLEEKNSHWESYDHGTLKRGRLLSYALESTLVIAYVGIAQNFQFVALLQAAVSLLLPEKALEMVSATVGLMGQVSERVTTQVDDTSESTQQQESRQQQSSQRPRSL